MKTYQASNDLIDILLQNGFIEDTKTTYPMHASRLKGDNYDAHHMKRHFSFPGTREKVLFDYINMRFPAGIGASSLNSAELRSLITYCKLSSPDRAAIQNEGHHSLSVHKLIDDVNRAPQIYSKAAYKRAKALYDSLIHIA